MIMMIKRILYGIIFLSCLIMITGNASALSYSPASPSVSAFVSSVEEPFFVDVNSVRLSGSDTVLNMTLRVDCANKTIPTNYYVNVTGMDSIKSLSVNGIDVSGLLTKNLNSKSGSSSSQYAFRKLSGLNCGDVIPFSVTLSQSSDSFFRIGSGSTVVVLSVNDGTTTFQSIGKYHGNTSSKGGIFDLWDDSNGGSTDWLACSTSAGRYGDVRLNGAYYYTTGTITGTTTFLNQSNINTPYYGNVTWNQSTAGVGMLHQSFWPDYHAYNYEGGTVGGADRFRHTMGIANMEYVDDYVPNNWTAVPDWETNHIVGSGAFCMRLAGGTLGYALIWDEAQLSRYSFGHNPAGSGDQLWYGGYNGAADLGDFRGGVKQWLVPIPASMRAEGCLELYDFIITSEPTQTLHYDTLVERGHAFYANDTNVNSVIAGNFTTTSNVTDYILSDAVFEISGLMNDIYVINDTTKINQHECHWLWNGTAYAEQGTCWDDTADVQDYAGGKTTQIMFKYNTSRIGASQTINFRVASSQGGVTDTDPPSIDVYLNGSKNSNLGSIKYKDLNMSFKSDETSTIRWMIDGNGTNLTSTSTGWVQDRIFTGSEGLHYLTAWADDSYGNSNQSVNVTFTIDTTLPSFTFVGINGTNISAINDSYFNWLGSTVNLSVAVSEDTSNITFRIDGSTGNSSLGVGTWAQKQLNFINDGLHNLWLWALDLAGNIYEAYYEFYIDTNPPYVEYQSANKTYVRPEQFINITAFIGDSNAVKSYKLNNTVIPQITGQWYGNYSTPNDWGCPQNGNCEWYFNATDYANNQNTTEKVVIIVDNTVPSIVLDTPTNNSFVNTGTFLNYSIRDANLGEVRWNNGSSNQSTLNNYLNISTFGWGDGRFVITVWANDSAGNTNTTYWEVVLDDTLPAVTIKYPLDGKMIGWQEYVTGNNKNLWINATINDTNHDYVLTNNTKWASSAITNGVVNISNVTTIPQGWYTILLTANDTAGNTGTANTTFLFDLYAPTVKNNSMNSTIDHYVKKTSYINWSFTANDTFVISSSKFNNTVATVSGSTYYNLSMLLDFGITSDGEYEIMINATDTAFNQNTTERIVFTVDDTPPSPSLSYSGTIYVPNDVPSNTIYQNFTVKCGDSNPYYAVLETSRFFGNMTLNETGTYSTTFLDLSTGEKPFNVTCYDKSGNINYISGSYSVLNSPGGSGGGGSGGGGGGGGGVPVFVRAGSGLIQTVLFGGEEPHETVMMAGSLLWCDYQSGGVDITDAVMKFEWSGKNHTGKYDSSKNRYQIFYPASDRGEWSWSCYATKEGYETESYSGTVRVLNYIEKMIQDMRQVNVTLPLMDVSAMNGTYAGNVTTIIGPTGMSLGSFGDGNKSFYLLAILCFGAYVMFAERR